MKSKYQFFFISILLVSSILFSACSSKMDSEQNNDSAQQTAIVPPQEDSVTGRLVSADKNTLSGTAENENTPVQQKNNLIFPLDTAKSWVRILVMKKGKLERIGHNHVIENRNLTGTITWNGKPENILAFLSLPVEQCIVDDAELRKKAGRGFEDEVRVNDILSIRRTMLGDGVLAAAEFPAIKISIQGRSTPSTDQAVDITLTIRGKTKTLRTVSRIYENKGTIFLSGQLSIQQSDFGITPITMLLGKLTIKDTIQISYHLEAVKN